MLRTYTINFISKVGLAIPLLYVTLISIFNQEKVISYWPLFLSRNINELALVLLTGLVSLFLIIWMFSGRNKFESSVCTLGALLLVAIANIRDIDVLFTLIPLICIALSLSLRYYPRIRVVAETKVSIPKENGGVHTTNDHDQHIFIPEN